MTVAFGDVPRDLSRIFYFFMKRGGKVTGRVHSIEYKRRPGSTTRRLEVCVCVCVCGGGGGGELLLKTMRV